MANITKEQIKDYITTKYRREPDYLFDAEITNLDMGFSLFNRDTTPWTKFYGTTNDALKVLKDMWLDEEDLTLANIRGAKYLYSFSKQLKQDRTMSEKQMQVIQNLAREVRRIELLQNSISSSISK